MFPPGGVSVEDQTCEARHLLASGVPRDFSGFEAFSGKQPLCGVLNPLLIGFAGTPTRDRCAECTFRTATKTRNQGSDRICTATQADGAYDSMGNPELTEVTYECGMTLVLAGSFLRMPAFAAHGSPTK
jgi:hypothetical protein